MGTSGSPGERWGAKWEVVAPALWLPLWGVLTWQWFETRSPSDSLFWPIAWSVLGVLAVVVLVDTVREWWRRRRATRRADPVDT